MGNGGGNGKGVEGNGRMEGLPPNYTSNGAPGKISRQVMNGFL